MLETFFYKRDYLLFTIGIYLSIVRKLFTYNFLYVYFERTYYDANAKLSQKD